jgi:hypothetical protein
LRQKQKKFPRLTQKIYVEDKEVKTKDGFSLIEPLLDANQTPHELHLIKKVAKLSGEPWWVRNAMRRLGFNTCIPREWRVVYSVRPNTTEVNAALALCKHMVKIVPVKFKNGFPTESDVGHTQLNLETGEFEIVKPLDAFKTDENLLAYKLNGVSISEQIKPGQTFPLKREDILKDLYRQRELQLLNDEYFPTKYEYKYDQDKPGVRIVRGAPDTSVKEDENREK